MLFLCQKVVNFAKVMCQKVVKIDKKTKNGKKCQKSVDKNGKKW